MLSKVEYLPRLAKFHLRKDRKETLQWFGKTEGGDGCPFGKNESACSFLLSFINVGKRVASSNDNFVIFGDNCEETFLVRDRERQFIHNKNVAASKLNCVIIYKE